MPFPHSIVHAQAKPLPAELQGIIDQLLGNVAWAGLFICGVSLAALVIIITLRFRHPDNLDTLMKGVIVVMICAGIVGSAAAIADYIYS